MKNLLLLIVLIPCLTDAQDITEKWNGILSVQGIELRLVFDISRQDSTYQATVDSPDQKAFEIAVSTTSFKNSTLTIEIAKVGVRSKGIEVIFYQSGQPFPLHLTRNLIEKKALFRPQEPKKPYPYLSEEVSFSSEKGKVELAGTLTLPEGKKVFPAAILITGYEPQSRDEEFMTHKPFLVLAHHLTKNGIAVLRYDERGFGQSSGNHGSATSADFAHDVRSAITHLKTRKEIDQTQIGLIGHSEGGLIAPLLAADTQVAYMILLAASGVPGSQVVLKQIESISRVQGMDEGSVQTQVRVSQGFSRYGEDKPFERRLTEYLQEVISTNNNILDGMEKEEFINMQVPQLKRPWKRFFLKYDPSSLLKRIQCPVLALHGEKDVQMAPENLAVIEKAIRLGGNDKVPVKVFPGMNHLLQTCKTGAMDEYATLEQTMDPSVLEQISGPMLKQTK